MPADSGSRGTQEAPPSSSQQSERGDSSRSVTFTPLDAWRALRRRRASAYHMALVTLLTTLAQGMPLASIFGFYSFLMCRVYAARSGLPAPGEDAGGKLWGTAAATFGLPPAPHLPTSDTCDAAWVKQATSTYSAAMATVGALLSLILLSPATTLANRFGRKPVLLLTRLLIMTCYLAFPLAPRLGTYVAPAVLSLFVVTLHASAGAPLLMAVQSYVVDCTSESSRAGALGFIEGFGQLGAFPASALGGLIAAATGQFFAPFYAAAAGYAAAVAFVLILTPESKKKRQRTLIDDWEVRPTARRGESGHARSASNASSSLASSAGGASRWRRLNFLSPLGVFLPTRRNGMLDLRLTNLAFIIIAEEGYQVFILPALLLYTADTLGFDVVQNGYAVSLLQGSRAVWLTLLFPRGIAAARRYFARRNAKKAAPGEATPLLAREGEEKDKARGKLDFSILLISYTLASLSFVLLALASSARPSPWPLLASSIVLLQLASGSISTRTAVTINVLPARSQSKAVAGNQILTTIVGATAPLLTSTIYSIGLKKGVPQVVWYAKAGCAGAAALGALGLFWTNRHWERQLAARGGEEEDDEEEE